MAGNSESAHPQGAGSSKPHLDPVVENLEAMVALRSYQANAQAAEIGKSMIQTAIELIA